MCKSIVDQINILDVNDLCEMDFGKVVQLSSLTLNQGITNPAYQISIDCHVHWKKWFFTGHFTGNPSGNFTGNPSGQWKNSAGSHNFLPVNFTGNLSENFTGNLSGNFTGNPSGIPVFSGKIQRDPTIFFQWNPTEILVGIPVEFPLRFHWKKIAGSRWILPVESQVGNPVESHWDSHLNFYWGTAKLLELRQWKSRNLLKQINLKF